MEINWLQVIVAYILGGLTFAMVKGFVSNLRSKVS
jgi:hypothetical protein